MKSKSEIKCIYFWMKISIFIKKIIQFFVIGEFLKFIVFIYLVLHLMLHYSIYKNPVVFTYKTCQNIFHILPRKLLFSNSGIFWDMHVLLVHRYQGIVIL